MKRKSILWLCLALLVTTLVQFQAAQAKPSVSPALQSSASDLIAEVNALRIANGLLPYTVNPILMQIAQDQANYMAATGQMAHRPGLTQRILAAGYPLAGDLSQGGFRAENISGASTAAQAVQRWTGDAPHLNTMLSPNLTEIGAGVAQVGDRYYMVIDCARPTTDGVPQAFTQNPESSATESFGPSDFIVPITTSTPDENGFVFHDVQYGQTLWSIAIEYGVKIEEIRALNNLGATIEIYQGDRLLVRKGAPPSTVTAVPTLETMRAPIETIQMTTTGRVTIPTRAFTGFPGPNGGVEGENSATGLAVGIVLASLLFAGLLTWLSSRRAV